MLSDCEMRDCLHYSEDKTLNDVQVIGSGKCCESLSDAGKIYFANTWYNHSPGIIIALI